MKQLHQPDLFAWSVFDTARNIDFHSVCWVRDGGNVLFDPLPLSPHDAEHIDRLGGVAHIMITNSDHTRAATEHAARWQATVWGPLAERDHFPIACDHWLQDGDEPLPGLGVLALEGSKTPGELAFLLQQRTLLTGDLIRAHSGGFLTMLPDGKLTDRPAAVRSVRRVADISSIRAVLVGDGWPVFRDGDQLLRELADRI